MKKAFALFSELVKELITAGIPQTLDLGVRSRIVFLNSVTLVGGLMITLFSFLGLSSGRTALGIASAIAALIVFANFAFVRKTRRYIAGGVVDCSIIFCYYYYLVLTGGEAGSGVLWIMTYPLIALFLLGPAGGTAMTLAFGVAVAAAIFHPTLNAAKFPPLYSARVVGTYFFIWVFGLIYEQVRRSTQRKLQSANDKLTRVTDELVFEKKQTDDIMGNVKEGIFLLSTDLKVGESYSAHLESILERTDLAGNDFLSLAAPALAERELASARDYFDLFLSGTVNEELIAEINPLADIDFSFARDDGSASSKRLRFSFTRVSSFSAPYPILGVVSDVTEEHALQKRLEAEEREHRREMEGLFQVVHVDPTMMREFIADTESELESVNELMKAEGASGKDVLETLFQSAHAVKGNAALLGLTEFSAKVHQFEEEVKAKLERGHEWRDLLKLTLSLAEISRELDALKSLIDKVLRFQSETRSAGLADSSLLRYSIEKLVKRESERTGVGAAVEFTGFGRRPVPDEYRKLVKDVLVQLIRNSFAHGFEAAALRVAAGKPEEGRISLSLAWGADSLTIRYQDDGKGLDAKAIREKARGIPEFAETADSLDANEIAKLIFRPGFSTAKGSDLSAGRGVGMALVKRRIGEAGGKLAVKSTPGKYLEFAITLPMPLSVQAVS